MTDDLEDFARWRGSVESRLGTLETAAAVQKAALKDQPDLRAAMDEDMGTLSAKFRTQEKLIQAISVTQSEHTTQLRAIEGRLEKVEGKLDLVHVGVGAIHTLLMGLTASETLEDDEVSANPVDGGPDALPGCGGEGRRLCNRARRMRRGVGCGHAPALGHR